MMDMKHLSLLFGLALLAASCTFSFPVNIVRGNGTAAEKTFEVGEFNSVSLVGSLDVIFAQSDEDHSVVLHTDENLIDDYLIEVKGDVLVISTKPGVSGAKLCERERSGASRGVNHRQRRFSV